MNVQITLKRGGIDMLSFDPEFQRRFEARLEEHEADGRLRDPDSLYRRFRKAQHDLIDTVARVLGDDGNRSFTITISVEGEKPVRPPGTWVDY